MANTTTKKHYTEYVSEKTICDLLGLKVNTIQNYVCTGKIPESAIQRSCVGIRTYHLPTILGLVEA